MISFLGALAGALSGIATGVGGGVSAAMNRDMSRESRAWQQMMSSTAHQRQVMDMRAAGLNPILSATGGRGASTPRGAEAMISNIGAEVASSAMQARKQSGELKLMGAQTGAQQAAAEKAHADRIYAEQQTANARIAAQGLSADATRKAHEAEISSAAAAAARVDKELWESEPGKVLRVLHNVPGLASLIGGGVGGYLGGRGRAGAARRSNREFDRRLENERRYQRRQYERPGRPLELGPLERSP